MELLKESTDEVLVESILDETTGKKRWFIEAITLQGDIVNANQRSYPFSVLKEAVERHVNKDLSKNRCVGCLNHPKDNAHEIDPEKISHVFTSVTENGKNFVTKSRVLDTPMGLITQSLLSEGIQLGISSRGLGSTKKSGSVTVVQAYDIKSLGDYVWENSAPDAICNAILENKEFLWENGILIQKDLSESIENYKVLIERAKARDVQKVIKEIFADYMKKIIIRDK